MKNTITALLLTIAALLLSGCVSSGMQNKDSIQISIAPAIDVAYAEAVKNIPEHIGVNVRWGGQVITVDDTGRMTRLTILAYPLNAKGQPEQDRIKGFVGGRFIVETDTFDKKNGSRFLTVYGPISGKQVLSNGKLTKTIPVVNALEVKEWTAHDQRYARQRHRLPYNGLELTLGHGRIGYDYYYNGYGYAHLSSFFYPYSNFSSPRFRYRHLRGRHFR